MRRTDVLHFLGSKKGSLASPTDKVAQRKAEDDVLGAIQSDYAGFRIVLISSPAPIPQRATHFVIWWTLASIR
ncbi:MAG: hypothetical protein EOP82_15785 [Variovorax sp.]|nr:MAG: hypothetical protein EOP82_15785 [Variovorax sp.]